MRILIKRIARYISKTNNYSKDEEEQVEYALRIFIFEALKVIGIIIVFSFLGHTFQAIIAIGTMSIVKPFIGGYHEDNQIKCFIFTLLVIGSIIYLGACLNLEFISKLILGVTSLYCIWHQAPVLNSGMLITRAELITRNRLIGISSSILFVAISIVLHKHALVSNTILWTIIFQALLMFNKSKEKYKLLLMSNE